MTLKSDAKFKEKLTYDFKYDMGNLVDFNQPNYSKVQKFHFDGLEDFQIKNFRGIMCHHTEGRSKI